MTTLRASSSRPIEQAVAMTISQIPTATWTSLLSVDKISRPQLLQFGALLVAKLGAEIPEAGITPSQDRIGVMIGYAVAQFRESPVGTGIRLFVQGAVVAALGRLLANRAMSGHLKEVSRQLRENLASLQP